MRVSKADGSQVLDLQRDALLSAGIPERNLYSDTASGKEALRLLGVFSSSRVRPPEIDCAEKESAEIRIGLEKAGLMEPKRLRATA